MDQQVLSLDQLDEEDDDDLRAAAMNACVDGVDTREPVDQRVDATGPAANPLA